jgi:dTDP-4-amino-4,6-dideoxygalactose transaminase
VVKTPSGNLNTSEPLSSRNLSIGAVSQLTTEQINRIVQSFKNEKD